MEGNQEKDEILTSLETLNLKINTNYGKYYHLVKTTIYNLRRKETLRLSHFKVPLLVYLQKYEEEKGRETMYSIH